MIVAACAGIETGSAASNMSDMRTADKSLLIRDPVLCFLIEVFFYFFLRTLAISGVLLCVPVMVIFMLSFMRKSLNIGQVDQTCGSSGLTEPLHYCEKMNPATSAKY